MQKLSWWAVLLVGLLFPGFAACGGTEVIYVETTSTEPSSRESNQANEQITLPRFTTTEAPADILNLSNEDFLALSWLTIRDTYGYCYTDCEYLAEPYEWISRAGGGFIDNEAILEVVAFIMTEKPSYEINLYCDAFYVMPDSEVKSTAIANGLNPKAWVVASYAICDS